MCGILATIGCDKSAVDTMLDAIEHRGRDNRGYSKILYNDSVIYLGHNRLAINDVSPAGNQPFIWDSKHLIVNGEIWNYPQLRKEYESRGYIFASNSDSEIILFLYKEGELNRLEGMFSFVIYDKDELIISRDWVGKLPLYYYTSGDTVIIASEIKAITSHTPAKDIHIVPKNSLVRINLQSHEVEVHSDYYFKFSSEPVVTELNTAIKRTHEFMTNAVNKRLLSDVPIATSLSGGLDSSVITYLLSTKIPNLKAYTIKFDEKSPDLIQARLVAKHLNIQLIEVEVPKDDSILKQRFLESIRVIEYPSTVQMQVGILQSFIAEKMAEDGIKVAFSGEGSDEAYGSYGMIRMFSKKDDWSDVRKKLFEKQHYGNLLRGNTVFMYYGTIELRCPFFDTEFLNYTTNLPNNICTVGSQWKYPLAEAFRPYLPESVIDQEKRAFQKGTNFKPYIENLIMNDTTLNFKNRKKMQHVIIDNFEKMYGVNYKNIKNSIERKNEGILKWTL